MAQAPANPAPHAAAPANPAPHAAAPANPTQHAVRLKLPVFWTAQPQVWFVQAEAQFHISQITADSTKYYHVVGALDQDAASRLVDLLRNPPDENKYEAIKRRLTETFGLDRRERASRLLHMDGLGDRKPSALMDEMLALADNHRPCLLFEQLFLEQMPDDIRLQLTSDDFADPRQLAARADTLWLAKQQGTALNATTAALSSTSNRPSPTTTGKKVAVDASSEWCYYHKKWNNDARKCRAPCAHPGNAVAGRQ
jgi:hypothetical protein